MESRGASIKIKLARGKTTSHSLQDGHENVTIEPEKALAMALHHGLGLPLSLVATLIKTTKYVIAKQVITGKRQIYCLAEVDDELTQKLRLF